MALLYKHAPSCKGWPEEEKNRLAELIQQRRAAIDALEYIRASALTGKIRTILYLGLRNPEINKLKAIGVI